VSLEDGVELEWGVLFPCGCLCGVVPADKVSSTKEGRAFFVVPCHLTCERWKELEGLTLKRGTNPEFRFTRPK
jgi:hypothetical protein